MGETYVQVASAPRKVVDAYRKINGVWQPSTELYAKLPGSGILKHVFSSEIVVTITSNRTDLILGNLFTTAQWQSSARKRVIISSGVVVTGSTAEWALAAQNGGQATATWGGTLTLENYGSIQGRGGWYNGGRGGHAIYPDSGVAWSKKMLVDNFGSILAGGGGGGRGGDGGGGYWTQEYFEGPAYDGANYVWRANYTSNVAGAIWGGADKGGVGNGGATEFDGNDGWRYYRGNYRDSPIFNISRYELSRRRWEGRWTNGGAGGTGGRGQGSDGGATGRNGGGAPGTNAGWGGYGGSGAGWGGYGENGQAGGGGNNGGGAGGQAGGAPGTAYRTAIVQMNNKGTVAGLVT
ncbi:MULTISPECIES: hypothetical protein [Agrobacterium]|uniref:hypothetical protein n=1 Tax=Agrobacterium TaxID=357 RepID=UPI0023011E37|nr:MULTISPECIES: hypothetical protein [Agrobacterium]MDA5627045.1 hypothetical protein [Agrobacterium sp. ST15.16.055]MDA6980154.1 hypothetical protein [Agrobacterium salinitolerans]